ARYTPIPRWARRCRRPHCAHWARRFTFKQKRKAMSSSPRLEFVTCASPAGAHRMAYWEWGDPSNDAVLVCVHGLTRNGRDFDPLARRLSDRYRVICPDIVGRGRSDWLIDPKYYTIPQYVADMFALLARLRARRVDW